MSRRTLIAIIIIIMFAVLTLQPGAATKPAKSSRGMRHVASTFQPEGELCCRFVAGAAAAICNLFGSDGLRP
jgi:hypothetical protein